MPGIGRAIADFPVFRYDGRAKGFYNAALIFVSLAGTIITSYRLTFRVREPDPIYWILTAVYVLDIAYSFNQSVRRGMTVLSDRRSIARNYLRGWFAVDLFAAFPFAAVVGLGHAPTQIGMVLDVFMLAKLLKMAKISKVSAIFRDIREGLAVNPAVLRLVTFGFWFVTAVHLMACGWCLIGASEQFRSARDQYLRALYWCLATIATIGYGDYFPDHDIDLQIIYTMVVMIFGVGMYGYIIGNVASLIANLDIARAGYQKRMEEINSFLRAKRVPPELQGRVRGYYAYLWETRKSVSAVNIVDELPPTLALEVLLFLNESILEKVDIFKDASGLFIREIVQLLRPMVFLPEDFIIRQGEQGDCMYFLSSGEAEVEVSGVQVAKLVEGSPFGETALLEGGRRMASIRALTYCDVYRLDKSDFDALRTRYPDFDARVREIVKSYRRETRDKTRE